MTADTIVLQPGGVAPQPLAVGDLGGLAVSRGRYGRTPEGLLIGFLVGGLVGTVVGYASMDSGDPYAGLGAFLGATVGGVTGLLVGGAIGAGTRREVWSEVPRRPRP